MAKRRSEDTLYDAIEEALDPGEFITYRRSWDFVCRLEEVRAKIDAMADKGKAKDAVGLIETFLAGCYEKAEEIDDSGGNLGMFFQDLFCSWIRARQEAGCDNEETVVEILNWMDDDNYGFCFEIEKNVVEVLSPKEQALFESAIKSRLDEAFALVEPKIPKRIYDYPYPVRRNAAILKVVYVTKKDIDSYVSLCERIGMTPRDCENIATLLKSKRRYEDALSWVDKGLDLEEKDKWPNHSSYDLPSMRRELLRRLGRSEDALKEAWTSFEKHPSDYSYDEFMKYVPKQDKGRWHEKVIEVAKKTSLSAAVELCCKMKEWDVMADRVSSAGHEDLEGISHYVIEPAARGLVKRAPVAAAKAYRALGMRILHSKKSKYYRIAIEHLRKAKRLYAKVGRNTEWSSLVEMVRKDHSRKRGFMEDFERMISGKHPTRRKSFKQRMRKRWAKQVSGRR